MDNDLKSVASARQASELAWQAYNKFLGTDPKKIDEIVATMADAIVPECKRLGEMAVAETGYGNVADKRVKNLFNAVAVAEFLQEIKTLGVLWQDDKTKIAAIGVPMGVVAALIPVTNPTSTIIFKVLSAVKAGNAIVCAPHPRGVQCGLETTRILAEAAEKMGAPANLIQCLDTVTQEGTAELMRHKRTSIIMATGGPAMVKAAYSSGKPTLAVGAGNVPCYVHQSMKDELAEIADMIISSKSMDYGTTCVSEQAVIADKEIARELRHELKMHGGYFCTKAEADRLAKVMFVGKQRMDAENVGQSPYILAEKAGFSIPPRTRILLADESKVGWERPLSAEKLNPVIAFYEAKSSEEGINLAESIAKFEGWGHTAVCHSNDPTIVAEYARIPTGRILVNTPAIHGGMGFSTDLEPSVMLGTGTWSGSITSDNVNALHLINIKRVAYENRPWRDIYEVYGE